VTGVKRENFTVGFYTQATRLGPKLYLLRHTFFWPSRYSFLAVSSYILIKADFAMFRNVV